MWWLQIINCTISQSSRIRRWAFCTVLLVPSRRTHSICSCRNCWCSQEDGVRVQGQNAMLTLSIEKVSDPDNVLNCVLLMLCINYMMLPNLVLHEHRTPRDEWAYCVFCVFVYFCFNPNPIDTNGLRTTAIRIHFKPNYTLITNLFLHECE